jgi:hypothetical protein
VAKPAIVASPEVQRVQARFEGREAIYIEKGAVRVRVNNIRATMPQAIEADIEEIPSPGLGVGRFDKSNAKGPRKWGFCAGFLTGCSDQHWTMGYGGWSLYFDPEAVQAVLDLASSFPEHVDSWKRYTQIIQLLQYGQRFQGSNWQRVFPDTQN